ncbi:uncharacterized protein DSM5745_06947 [Aspergillus mulundensis]|uniref:Uncharacterized protein n=1 Tax=Aspergillus mulundensis TaxID=1810919 RepID=A0A3D8RJR3_9EURO|nr:hypothetical protein DSM5745_06947 [Aspergillus mulundensis]RDW74285.1 hypothetical protein DSM5745_06947 [Aspergillus mulundensis]
MFPATYNHSHLDKSALLIRQLLSASGPHQAIRDVTKHFPFRNGQAPSFVHHPSITTRIAIIHARKIPTSTAPSNQQFLPAACSLPAQPLAMACPITVTKFIGTISLGLLTGLSYSAATITIPSLSLLSTSTAAAKSLSEVKRLTRRHAVRLTNISTVCLLFAYAVSPRHRKHPYLLWMAAVSTLGTYGVDFWFHRRVGGWAWGCALVRDLGWAGCFGKKQRKEEDLVVVEAEAEAEEGVNGEVVRGEMDVERRMQGVRAVFAGVALAMGIVGLWGDRRP